jgi:hypothetical protein
MGFRFHRILNIIPGVRVNVSKSGLSTSVGPRGADINIGRHGVTTNAGIPGTGLSYRQKLGKPGSWVGVGTVLLGLALSAYRYSDKIADYFSRDPAQTAHATASHTAATHTATAANAVEAAATPAGGVRYVHRGNSDLRGAPSTSSAAIKKEPKGAQVTLLAVAGKWAKVQDGSLTGWMRTSVLGENPPE